MRIDDANAEIIRGDFREVHFSAIDPSLYEKVKDYKQRVASTYKSIRKESIDQIRGEDFSISLKLDGENCALFYENGEIALIRPRGYAYLGLPLLDDAKAVLEAAGVQRGLFPGELYVHREDGARTRVFDVISLTKSPKSDDDLERLRFAPFDIIELDDEHFNNHRETVQCLRKLFGDTKVAPAPTELSQDRRDISKFYDRWVNKEGAEGLMIRTNLTFRYKLKAQHTIDAAIIGYTCADDMVTSVLTGLVDPDGAVQVLTAVEKGFSDIDRIRLFEELEALRCESDYLEVSRFYTPFFMVRPKIIIEFACDDMVAETTSGKPIRMATLRLKDHKYRLLRSTPFVSLKHCVFQRFREDKSINPTDLRVAQVTDYIFIDIEQSPAEEIRFPEVELISRDVYVKEVKDKVSVRKIVVWATNKEEMDVNYSAYVMNYTDYSPNRKEPLQQDVRISNSKQQILQIARDFIDAKIKKGWVRCGREDEA